MITESGPPSEATTTNPRILPMGLGRRRDAGWGAQAHGWSGVWPGLELAPSLRSVLHLSGSEADVGNGAHDGHKEVPGPKPSSGFLPQGGGANEETRGPRAVCPWGWGATQAKGDAAPGLAVDLAQGPAGGGPPKGEPLQVRKEEPQQVTRTPPVSLLPEGKDLPEK